MYNFKTHKCVQALVNALVQVSRNKMNNNNNVGKDQRVLISHPFLLIQITEGKSVFLKSYQKVKGYPILIRHSFSEKLFFDHF